MATVAEYKALAGRAKKQDFSAALQAEKEWLESGLHTAKWSLEGRFIRWSDLPADVAKAAKAAWTNAETREDAERLRKGKGEADSSADTPAEALPETGDRQVDALTATWATLSKKKPKVLASEDLAGIRRHPVILVGARIPEATKQWLKGRACGLTLLTAGYPCLSRGIVFGIVESEHDRLVSAYGSMTQGVNSDPLYRGVAKWLSNRSAVILDQHRKREGTRWYLVMDQAFARSGRLDTWLWPDSR